MASSSASQSTNTEEAGGGALTLHFSCQHHLTDAELVSKGKDDVCVLLHNMSDAGGFKEERFFQVALNKLLVLIPR